MPSGKRDCQASRHSPAERNILPLYEQGKYAANNDREKIAMRFLLGLLSRKLWRKRPDVPFSDEDEQIARFNREQSQWFDELHRRFLEPLPADVIERMQRIVAAPEIRSGETVLDVGTGTGALLPLIRRYRPGRLIACDLSAKMLEQVARLHPGVELHRVDIRDLELPETSIDVVFMNGMFGNIADKQGALGNVGRMLRSGGRVVISHPEGRSFVAGIARAEPFPITPLPSREQAEELLHAARLAVCDYIDEEKLLICLAVKT